MAGGRESLTTWTGPISMWQAAQPGDANARALVHRSRAAGFAAATSGVRRAHRRLAAGESVQDWRGMDV